MNDAPESGRERKTEPPDPNTTPADVLRALGTFKKEFFAYLDEKEEERGKALGALLDKRDDNVNEQLRGMREDLRRISDELSTTLPKLKEDVKRLDQEVDGHDWWREEFRERTHGIRNAFLAIIGAVGDLMVRIDKIDHLGADVAPLMDAITRMLTFKRDTDVAPPPASSRSEIPPPPPTPDAADEH